MKKRKWTSEENKLASMLAWVCCHADEDCPSEYRTKHFREHLKEAVDYLENSGGMITINKRGVNENIQSHRWLYSLRAV